jgi:hypothetical protein
MKLYATPSGPGIISPMPRPRVKGASLRPTPMGSPLKANTRWCVGALTRGGDHLRGDWELVRLDEMREPRILDGTFQTPRIGYRRGDKRLRSIFAQL